MVAFRKMEKGLEKKGYSEESAKTITATAGRKKLGNAKMTKLAVAGKRGLIMPKVSRTHLKKDKKESKAIYNAAEKIEKNAEKLMDRDKKVKRNASNLNPRRI